VAHLGSPPHSRGALVGHGCDVADHGITPAFAGSTSLIRSPARSAWDHPRIRGEHTLARMPSRSRLGSPPHSRGAPTRTAPVVDIDGITLAFAGSTTGARRGSFSTPDHPRIRGEHLRTVNTSLIRNGSPPHSRGALSPDPARPPLLGITPAFAGSTLIRVSELHSCRDHPRIRGEHGYATATSPLGPGSPPHSRGARCK